MSRCPQGPAWHLPDRASLGAEMGSALGKHDLTQRRLLGKGPPSEGEAGLTVWGAWSKLKRQGPLLEIKIASCRQRAAAGIPGPGNRGRSQAPGTPPRAPSPGTGAQSPACAATSTPPPSTPKAPGCPPKLGAPVKFSSCRNSAPQRTQPQPRAPHPAHRVPAKGVTCGCGHSPGSRHEVSKKPAQGSPCSATRLPPGATITSRCREARDGCFGNSWPEAQRLAHRRLMVAFKDRPCRPVVRARTS